MLQLRNRGRGQRGTLESVRIHELAKHLLEADQSQNPVRIVACQPLAGFAEEVTQDQLTYTLSKVVDCPILYTNTVSSNCDPVYTTPIPPLTGPGVEPPQGPAVTRVYRNMSRIYSTDQIARPAITPAGSARTAQIKASIAAASQTRYVQVDIPVVNRRCS
jgi:hypothetical protein